MQSKPLGDALWDFEILPKRFLTVLFHQSVITYFDAFQKQEGKLYFDVGSG